MLALLPPTSMRSRALSHARLISFGRRTRRAVGTAAAAGRVVPSPMPSRHMLGEATPPLDGAHHFVNLTNGLEALPVLETLGLPLAGFVRLQSTACEQFDAKNSQILDEIDANLLTRLALDEPCFVWDYGSRNPESGVPRALWYGLEWVRFACARSWGKAPSECKSRDDALPRALLRGKDVRSSFEERYRNLPQRTARKLRYYRRFRADLEVDPEGPAPEPPGRLRVPLYGVYGFTDRDNDTAYYVDTCRKARRHGKERKLAAAGGEKDDVSRLHAHGLALWTGGVTHAERDAILHDS